LDGSQKAEISGETGWQTVTYSLPEGEHTIKWQYSKDGSDDNGSDCGWVRMKIKGLDFGDATYIISDFPCSWGGDANWKNDNDGSLRSGKITHNQSSWMEMKAFGEGVLTYRWKASCEYWVDEIFDYGYLSVDGEDMGWGSDDAYSIEGVAIGGQTGWQEVEVDIEGDGEHQFRWTFVKDDIDEEILGEDCIWVKDIMFRPWITLNFDIGGAEGLTPTTVKEPYETEIELPRNDKFSNGNLGFAGWDAAGVKYAGGAVYKMPHTNVTLTAIWMEKRRLSFDLNGGEGVIPDSVMDIPEAVVKLPLYEGFNHPFYTLMGWSDGENVYVPGANFEMRSTNVTLTAVYRANTIAIPVITSVDVSNSGTHNKATTRINIRADAGATIYYTLDGSVPTSKSTRYDGQFAADAMGSVTVKAIALRDNYFDSPVATFSFTRRPYSAAECLNVVGWQVDLSGDAEW
jgi:hypothetical protein